MKRSPTQNRMFPVLLTFVLLVAVVLMVRLTPQKSQETRTHAAQGTKLYFTPTSSGSSPIQKQTGDTFTVDIMVDPGPNVVSFLKFEVLYDSTVLSLAQNGLAVNTTAFPATIEGPIIQSGRIAASVGIGSVPTNAIITPTKVATLTFSALKASGSPVEIKYGSISQALSIGPNDRAGDNVLATTESAFVVIGQLTATLTPGPTSNNPTPTGSNPTPTGIDNPTPTTGSNPTSTPVLSPTPSGPQGCNPAAGHLAADQEVPASTSQASGDFTITFGSPTSNNAFNATINLTNTLQSHVNSVTINGPADAGIVGPVVLTLYSDSGTNTFPQTFSKSFTLSSDIVTAMQSGQAYINILTDQFQSVEIRGQIVCASLTPQPSIDPTHTRLLLNLLLDGVGNAGDNPNPTANSLSNKQPVHATRPVNVQVLNNNNQIVATKLATVAYDQTKGTFTGIVDLGTGLNQGNYVLKIKSDRYLRKLLPGFYTLQPAQQFEVKQTNLVAGDVNDDNVVNVLDYGVLFDCGYGALNPIPMNDLNSAFQQQACQAHTTKDFSDMNDDGKVDASDYNLFIRELSVQFGE